MIQIIYVAIGSVFNIGIHNIHQNFGGIIIITIISMGGGMDTTGTTRIGILWQDTHLNVVGQSQSHKKLLIKTGWAELIQRTFILIAGMLESGFI